MTVKRVFCAVFACFVLFSGTCFAAAPYISNQTSLDVLGRAAEEGDYVFFNFKSAAFADPDGDTVRYRAEAGGLNITSGAGSGYWLTFLGGHTDILRNRACRICGAEYLCDRPCL